MAKKGKLSKQEVKAPDQFQQVGGAIYQYTEKHLALVSSVIVGVFLLGLGYVLYGQYEDMQKVEKQGIFYTIEKPFLDKKLKFEEAVALKDSLEGKKPEEKKKLEEELKKLVQPTGDLNKDYADDVKKLDGFIDSHPKSVSSIYAALHLADLYTEYKKPDDGLAVVKKVSQNHRPESMVSGLLWSYMGNLYAEKGDCAQAQTTWQTVINSPGAEFMKNDLKLKMALCYQKTDAKKSKEMLKALALDFPDSASGRAAKKYLRGL